MALFMGLLLRLRSEIPMIPVLNKSDVAGGKVFEIIDKLITNPLSLVGNLRPSLEGVLDDVVKDVLDLIDKTKSALRLVKVSARTGEGIEDLHYIIHETLCTCGDLT